MLVQLGWWACVLGAARGLFFVGPLIVALLIVIQIGSLPNAARRRACRAALLVGVSGTAADSILTALGLLRLHGSPIPWLAPLWITALWCQFATVLPAFSALRSRPILAGMLGAVGGPLAYAGGARLGAAALHAEPWASLLAVGCVWGMALPLMLRSLVCEPDSTGDSTAGPWDRLSCLNSRSRPLPSRGSR